MRDWQVLKGFIIWAIFTHHIHLFPAHFQKMSELEYLAVYVAKCLVECLAATLIQKLGHYTFLLHLPLPACWYITYPSINAHIVTHLLTGVVSHSFHHESNCSQYQQPKSLSSVLLCLESQACSRRKLPWAVLHLRKSTRILPVSHLTLFRSSAMPTTTTTPLCQELNLTLYQRAPPVPLQSHHLSRPHPT